MRSQRVEHKSLSAHTHLCAHGVKLGNFWTKTMGFWGLNNTSLSPFGYVWKFPYSYLTREVILSTSQASQPQFPFSQMEMVIPRTGRHWEEVLKTREWYSSIIASVHIWDKITDSVSSVLLSFVFKEQERKGEERARSVSEPRLPKQCSFHLWLQRNGNKATCQRQGPKAK